jgi:hypothetical protein
MTDFANRRIKLAAIATTAALLLHGVDPAVVCESEVLVSTIRGDTVRLAASDTTARIVVFSGGYSCVDCFRAIVTAIDSIRANVNGRIELTAIARPGGGGVARRAAQRLATDLLGRQVPVYYDIIAEGQIDPWPPMQLVGGLFGRYNVSRTPAILVMTVGATKFVNYDALFSGLEEVKSANALDSVTRRIGRLLHQEH